MKTTVAQWFQWFGEAMTHALGSFNDRHLQPPPIGTQLPGHAGQAGP